MACTCIDLCGCVHTGQRQIRTQIPIMFYTHFILGTCVGLDARQCECTITLTTNVKRKEYRYLLFHRGLLNLIIHNFSFTIFPIVGSLLLYLHTITHMNMTNIVIIYQYLRYLPCLLLK